MMRARLLAGLALAALAGCRGSGPLEDPSAPGRLLDGDVVMTTRRSLAAEATPDVRTISCRNGVVTVVYDGRDGRLEGEASAEDWRRLWKRMEPVSPFGDKSATVEPDDPEGGPYHVVRMVLGEQARSFSAQLQGGVVQFGTRNGVQRMEYANAVVDFVASYATRRVRSGPAPAASRPAAPPAEARPAGR
jgi:hypothetical protein